MSDNPLSRVPDHIKGANYEQTEPENYLHPDYDIPPKTDPFVDHEALLEVAANQRHMQETLDAILAKFDEVASQITPLVDQLAKHPMAKMLGLNK